MKRAALAVLLASYAVVLFSDCGTSCAGKIPSCGMDDAPVAAAVVSPRPATGDDDPYWCYRDMQTTVMEGQPPPCPPRRDAGTGPGK